MAVVDGGPVVAHAQAFADEINRRFGFTHIMTYAGHDPDQQHALDNFGPPPNVQAKMLELAWWCTRDDVIDHFGIDYVIFNADPSTVGGEIWNREIKRAWRQMPDRGGVTQNHHDHVHVSFNKTGSATPFGGPPSPIPIILPVHVLEEGMFTVPPDGKPHDYPVPSWAKTVKVLSTGTDARIQVGRMNGTKLEWPEVRERGNFGNNLSKSLKVPERGEVFGATNWGPNDLAVIYDVA